MVALHWLSDIVVRTPRGWYQRVSTLLLAFFTRPRADFSKVNATESLSVVSKFN